MTGAIALVGAARAISLILGVVLLAVLGRRLGPGGFGVLQFALAVIAYPLIIVDLGLTTYGVREIARGLATSALIRRILGARLTLALLAALAVIAGSAVLPLNGTTRAILLILALGLPASAVNARWILQGERRFARSAAIEAGTSGAQLLAVLALVNEAGDALAAALALTAAAWIATALSLVLVGRSRMGLPSLGRAALTIIAKSLPLGAAAVAITVYYSVDTVLLGLFRGVDEVAYYAAAYRILLPVLSLAGVVGTVAISQFSVLVAGDAALAERAVINLARSMILLAFPMAVGGALAAEPIVRLVFGEDFLPAVAAFRILVWSIATVYANAAFAFLLLARGADRLYLAAVSAGAVANVSLNLLVIPIAGMIGAALVTMVSEVTVLALLLWWTRDVARLALPRALARAAVPTAAMAAVVWPIHDSLAAIPVGAVAFGVAAAATGAIPAKRALRHGMDSDRS